MADVPVSKVDASAPEPTSTEPPTEGGNCNIDELFTKLVESRDLGESVTEDEVAYTLAEKNRDAFLEAVTAVDVAVTPTFSDGLGPEDEALAKPVDVDVDANSTWRILDFLQTEPDHEEDDSGDDATPSGEITGSNVEKATKPVEKQESRHRLSRALQR